ncbi:hypothetical protein GCM10010459_13020 [Microbacterium schleiferi]
MLTDRAPAGETEPGTQALAAPHGVGAGPVQQDRFVAEQLSLRLPDLQEIFDSLRNCRNRITTY